MAVDLPLSRSRCAGESDLLRPILKHYINHVHGRCT